jgi:hypothetical protein
MFENGVWAKAQEPSDLSSPSSASNPVQHGNIAKTWVECSTLHVTFYSEGFVGTIYIAH